MKTLLLCILLLPSLARADWLLGLYNDGSGVKRRTLFSLPDGLHHWQVTNSATMEGHWVAVTGGGDAGGTNSRQYGSQTLTNLSGLVDFGFTNIAGLDFLTNWVNSVSNRTTAVTNSAGVTNWINFRQPADARLTNLAANPIPFTNVLVQGSGITLTTNSGEVTIAASAGGGDVTTAQLNNASNTVWTWANAISNRSPYLLFSVTNDVIMTNISTARSGVSNIAGTQTIPAGVLRPGSVIRLRVEGQYGSTSSAGGHLNQTNSLLLGGVVVATNCIVNFASMSRECYVADLSIVVRSNGAGGLVTSRGFQMKATAAGGAAAVRQFNLPALPVVAVNLSGAVDVDFRFHGTNTTGFTIRSAVAEVVP